MTEINEIVNILNEAKNRIASIEEIIADYNNCNSDKSKQLLLAAITRLAAEFKAKEISR